MNELGKMESASTIFDRQHATFGYIYEQKREPVPIAQMPLDCCSMRSIAAEDNRFYTHNGSDLARDFTSITEKSALPVASVREQAR